MQIVPVDKISQDHIRQINQIFKDLELRTYLSYSEEDGLGIKKTQQFIKTKKKELKQKQSIFWVALEGDEVQGVLEMRFFLLTKQKHKMSFGIWVRKDKHKTGIGSMLMEHLISYAKSNGVKRIEGEVYCKNTAALALYKKYGFEIEGTLKCAVYYKGVCEDLYCIAKLL